MITIRKFILILAIAVLVVSACTAQAPANPLPTSMLPAPSATASRLPVTPTPQITRTIEPTVLAAMKNCANIFPGQACLVEGPVQVTAQTGRTLRTFRQPGQVVALADLKSLKLGESGSTKGLVVMKIQTERSGGAFFVEAFGNVELVNQVLYGTREFNPMQSLKLATGVNRKGEPPTSGLLVQAPKDGKISTLVINGLEMMFGSTALLTSGAQSLTVQTLAGIVTVNKPGHMIEVVQGTKKEIPLTPHTPIEGEELLEPLVPREGEDLLEPLVPREGEDLLEPLVPLEGEDLLEPLVPLEGEDLLTPLTNLLPEEPDAYAASLLEEVHNMIKKMLADREKQKAWKGGWWKMTYGPTSMSGKCKIVAAGDGGGGGDGKPYTTEIPICRGNNGNTILMYNSGTSYDRIGPNLFAKSYVSEFDLYGKGNYTIEGRFSALQVVSPTRMILSHANTESGACTTGAIVYLDFVRDDPNVRCGQIISIDPYKTPKPATPTPEPKKVDPPAKGPYQVRLATLPNVCSAAAKPFAPNFTTANLSLSPQNQLVIEASLTKFELEMSDQVYSCSNKENKQQQCLGLFTLQQPVNNTYGLMMSLGQVPGQQWSGSWVVANQDASQMCAGSIDLLPPK